MRYYVYIQYAISPAGSQKVSEGVVWGNVMTRSLPDRNTIKDRTLRQKCYSISVHLFCQCLSTGKAAEAQTLNAHPLMSAHVMPKESMLSSEHHAAGQHDTLQKLFCRIFSNL